MGILHYLLLKQINNFFYIMEAYKKFKKLIIENSPGYQKVNQDSSYTTYNYINIAK